MSKHPTSNLTPRDIASMKYGAAHEALMEAYRNRHSRPFSGLAKAILPYARNRRNRIFLHCIDCRFVKSFSSSGWHCSKLSESRPVSYACICPHYKERREANG